MHEHDWLTERFEENQAHVRAARMLGSLTEAEDAVQESAIGAARGAQAALVNGAVGVVVARRGRLHLVHRLTIEGGKIAEIHPVADPARLRQHAPALLDD